MGELNVSDQIQALNHHFKELEGMALSYSVGMASYSLSGIAHMASASSSTPSWVVDSGATNHVTGMCPEFISITPSPSLAAIRVANGNHIKVLGEGTVDAYHALSLKSVLHVPQFSHNLLSVSSIVKSHNCSITFYPLHCVFKDMETGKTIGGGRQHGGLYFLEAPQRNSVASQSASTAEAMLKWHRRLGHAPVRSPKSAPSLPLLI